MTFQSLGDLSSAFLQQNRNLQMRGILRERAEEATTGIAADIPRAMAGNLAPLAQLERRISALDAFETVAIEAAVHADAIQSTLESTSQRLGVIVQKTLAVTDGADPTQLDAVAAEARQELLGLLSGLNTQAGGKSLFAGSETSFPALRAAPDIMSDIEASVAGLATALDVLDRIDAYFAAGGDFDANDYIGSASGLDSIRTGSDRTIALDLRADDPRFRDALAALAKMAVLDGDALQSDPVARMSAIELIKPDLLPAQRQIIGMMAETGAVQAAIEEAETRLSAEAYALRQQRLDRIGIDQYEAAVRFEDASFQLEALYGVTVRLSGLSLVNFL